MESRKLLWAALLLAVLAGLYWWSEKQRVEEAANPKPDPKLVKVVAIPEDQIQRVHIARREGSEAVVQHEGRGWKLTAPEARNADTEAVQSVVRTLGGLNADRVVEEKSADLGQFGLAKPALQVTVVKKDGKSQKLLLGDETPTKSGVFAKLADDPRVFTVASISKTDLDKSAQDLQDKRLLTTDFDQLTQAEWKTPKQMFQLARGAQGQWQVVKPQPMRTEANTVEDMLRRLREARFDPAAAEEPAATFGAASPVATVSLTDKQTTQQLEVRRGKENTYYVRSSAVPGVHKVTAELGMGVDKSLDDLRSRKLFDFGFNDPTRVEVKDGAQTYLFQKSREKWQSNGKTMDTISVQTLIDKLRDLQGTQFAAAPLNNAALELAVTEADGKTVERVRLGQQGEQTLAQREGDPTAQVVDAKTISTLQSTTKDVKEAPAAKK